MRRELGVRIDAGVRREDVDAAEGRERRGRQRLDRGAIGDVGRDGDARPPPQLGGRALGGDPSMSAMHDARALRGEHRGDAAADAACRAGDDGDLIGEWLHAAGDYSPRPMQRFLARMRSTTTAPTTRRSGRSSPASASRSSRSRASATPSRRPDDWTPESYAVAEKLKWAVIGPIDVAGARPATPSRSRSSRSRSTTPGVVVYGRYTAEDPYDWWDEENACAIYRVEGGSSASTSTRRCRPGR